MYAILTLQEHGLKVYHRDPYSYTPIKENLWWSPHVKSLTLGRNPSNNKKEIAKFSKKDAEVYKYM